MKNRKAQIAWAIIHQLISKTDEKLIPVMTHPCGEQDKCLTLYKSDGEDALISIVDINMCGIGILVQSVVLQYDIDITNDQIEKLVEKIIEITGLRLRSIFRRLHGMEYIRIILESDKLCKVHIENAWYDGSYHCCLTKEAETFPFYPVSHNENWYKHINWWIISYDEKVIAVCNLETDELIAFNGRRYDLKTQKEGAISMTKTYIQNSDFNKVIEETRMLLFSNTEWHDRYAMYAKEITTNINFIGSVRKKFHEWAPLKIYLNVTNAKNALHNVK